MCGDVGNVLLTVGLYHDCRTLLPYQHGAASTFIKHIEEGTRIAKADEQALLIFSGGETRNFAGPLSEAQSYWVIIPSGWFHTSHIA